MTDVPYVTKILKQSVIVFNNCDQAKFILSAPQNWLEINANININIDLTIKTVLFFKNKVNKLLNHLLILARSIIYKTKFKTNYITLETFISYLRRKYKTEKYISSLHNNHELF